MASQIITTAVTTPVSITDDTIILGETGSISLNAGGTALTLKDAFTAVIEGDIYVIDGIGIRTNNSTILGSLQINETARIVSISDYDYGSIVEGIGIRLTGYGTTLFNSGYIEGTNGGVVSVYDAITINLTVENSGQIVSDIGVFYNNNTDTNTVNNATGALIHGDRVGIYATSTYVNLVVNNDGTIIGNVDGGKNAAAINSSGRLDLTNTGTIEGGIIGNQVSLAESDKVYGSKIVNTGEILAGGDGPAISLGDAADIVWNKGTINGEIWLGDGRDIFLGGAGDETVLGGAGRDIILGGAGDDIITGGRGNDIIDAGKGADVLIFAVGDGNDRVFNFEPGRDVIDLSDYHFDSLSDVAPFVTEYSDRVVFDPAGSHKLVLMGVQLSDMSPEDVIL